MFIETLTGEMKVEIDDWIVKGDFGELHLYKPDVFLDVYEKVDDANVPREKKSLDVTNMDEARSSVPDIEVFGDPGAWVLICKASSKSQGWMKSTKAMQLPDGCLIQVSTQQGDNVAESICFVPGLTIEKLLSTKKGL